MKKSNQPTQTSEPKSLFEKITDKWLNELNQRVKLQCEVEMLQEQINRKYTISLN